jgi:hypothetical protein
MKDPAATTARAGRAPGPAPLATTASMTTLGHLAWIGWLWLATAVVVVAIVLATGVGDASSSGDSLWQGAGAGWQRWLLLGAGAATTSTFGPMLIGNGVTRARLSASVQVSMVLLAVLGSLFIVGGYLLEGALYDAQQRLDDGRTVDGVGMLAGLGVRYALTLAVSFLSGWLIGIGFYRYGRDGGIPLIPLCLVPLALVELLLLGGGTGLSVGPLEDVSGPPLAVAAPAALAVIAAGAAVATRYTRGLALTE